MLTNEELKKKIVDIIQMKLQECSFQPIGITYGEAAEYVADALIASVIGDVKDLQAQVDSLEITNIALQAGYDDAEKDRLYWVDKYKEAEHRADKAKKDCDAYKIALRKALKTDNCAECFSTISVDNECFTQWGCDRGNEKCINTLFKQAEKELAEEGER